LLAEDMQVLYHATDPRFWSQPETDSYDNGPQGVTLGGNFNCNPIIEIKGGYGSQFSQNPAITINGDTISFAYVPGALWDIFVNFDTHYAYDAANSNANVPVGSGTWGTLLPGSNTVSASAAEGAGEPSAMWYPWITALNITWASAWIL
jgi:phage-related protein